MIGRPLAPMLAVLGEHNEVIVCEYDHWHPWYHAALAAQLSGGVSPNIVAQETVRPGVRVSTVFLGMNANAQHPTWFETRVFGGPLDGEVAKYATWAEAEVGHARMAERVRGAMTETTECQPDPHSCNCPLPTILESCEYHKRKRIMGPL